MTRRAPRILTIVSSAPHHVWEDRLWSHEPYVREIDLWAHLFERVVIVGPTETTRPTGDCIPFASPAIELRPVPPTGGDSLGPKLRQLLLLPVLVGRVCRALLEGDVAHVRCPGNMGLLGVFLAPLLRRRLVAKYAGQWNGFPGEKWTVRLQRAVLSSWWWRGPVTVYGEWPDQPDHVVAFFTSVLTADQVARARRLERAPRRAGGLDVLFVGRLSGPKNVDTMIEAVATLAREGLDVTATVVGDGAERGRLEAVARDEGVADRVTFAGAVGLDRVLDHYERADALVLVSQSEGWPKAIAEAMTFGVVCVGSDRGMVPQMLGEGRGLVVPPGEPGPLADALRRLVEDPAEADAMGRRAAAWGQRHSLEELEDAIAALLTDWWATPVGRHGRRRAVLHVTDTLEAGGAERMAVNLINGLDRARFRPFLCTTRRDGVLAAEARPDITTLSLGRRRRRDDPIAVLRLAAFLRRHRVDLVHAHGTSLFISAAARVLVPRTRLVWHDHLGADPATRLDRRRLYRLAARRVDRVITVSRVLEEWDREVLGFPADRLVTISNFVVDRDPARSTPSLPGTDGRRVACVANLRRQKDHATLLTAWGRVQARVPDAHLLLVGAPVDATVATAVAEQVDRSGLGGHVTVMGPRSDVADLLAACDVGVLSSRSEGFPLALLEYGSAGLAVVATEVGECPAILDDGRAGLLVPPGDPAALADALVEVLEDDADRTRLAERLHARVAERYGAAAVIGRVERIYDDLAGGRDAG